MGRVAGGNTGGPAAAEGPEVGSMIARAHRQSGRPGGAAQTARFV